MTPERWQKVGELYEAALERAPDDRADFVRQACHGDSELHREVLALLAADDSAGSFMSGDAMEDASRQLANDQTAALIGQTLGQYKVLELIGRGGMGEVYLAEDTRLKRKVAIKLLPPYFLVSRDRVTRFSREARAVSALNHPNIVTIHEVGRYNSSNFIVTEFVEGHTLRESMSARLDILEALDLTIQIANALDAAHAAGIIHRDIKPENVMVRNDGYVKVLDFGLAKLTDRETVTNLAEAPTKIFASTQPGLVMGSTSYMSPEQARATDIDARTDIWSLGIVLYEMLTGHAPFEGETASHVIVSILESEPEPLARQVGVPVEAERIIMKALRKNRQERYGKARDMALDLKNLKKELEIEARLKQPPRPGADNEKGLVKDDRALADARNFAARGVGAKPARATASVEYLVGWTRRHRLGAALAAAVAVALLTAIVYFNLFAGRDGSARSEAIDSLAVLPFVNAGGDPDTEYLSDGISESLINSLSRLSGVKVIGSSSSFRYKGKDADPQEVAKALGVKAIVTGRAARRGEDLFISVELFDARDKTRIWGGQYNRKATDALSMQAEISRDIVEKLRLHLTGAQERRLAKRETTNPQAYELLLKGRSYLRRIGERENLLKAAEYYNQAIAADPACAPAYAELAVVYRVMMSNGHLDPKEGMPKAEGAALKALELDEGLAEPHMAIALLRTAAWDWETAEREFKRALELNPNFALAHRWYSSYLCNMGQFDEAIAEIKRAQELDPLSINIRVVVGRTYWAARQHDKAIEVLKKALELDSNYRNTYAFLCYAYTAKGMYREAIAAIQQAGSESFNVQVSLGVAYAGAGERQKAQALLRRLETNDTYVSPAVLSQLYAALGEREKAFASLERAYAEHDLQLQSLGYDPYYDSLRSDARFADLLRRLKLPPEKFIKL